MGNESYRIQRARTIWPLGHPLVISATGKRNEPKKWWGEYFIFIEGPYPFFKHQHSIFNFEGLPPGITEDESQFTRNEIDRQVDDIISGHLYAQYEKTGQDHYLQKIDLKDVGKEELLRYWYAKKQLSKELEAVKTNTQCKELKEYLDIIMNLPPIISLTNV